MPDKEHDSVLAWCRTHVEARRQAGGRDFAYSCAEDFLLRHGSFYVPAQRPRGFRRGTPGECFWNAFRLARRRGLVYVEGLAAGACIPVYHGWVCRPGSHEVIEVTWGSPGSAYFGVAFDTAYARKCLCVDDCPVLQNYRDRFRLFQGLVPESVWVPRPQD